MRLYKRRMNLSFILFLGILSLGLTDNRPEAHCIDDIDENKIKYF